MNWTLIPFEKLYSVDSRNGLTKPSKVRGSGFKMINMGELFANDRIYDIPMELVPLNAKEKVSAKVEKDDLLFARQSLVLEGAGKCSIVMDVSPLTVFESHIIRVRLNQEFANPLFYYYYFRSPYSPIKTIVSQCAQAGIRGSDLQKLEVVFPPIETQNRIADILSAYDNLIENNQKQIKLLEEAAQRLYKEWFVDLRFPGYEDTPIVDGVPEGWEKAPIDSRISLLSGYAFKSAQFDSSGEYKIVTIKNVKDGEFDGINTNRIVSIPGKMPKHCVLTDGDILLSLTGNVGRTCIVNGNNYLLNQRVAKLHSDIPAFTYCLFRSSDMFDAMNNLANGTAQQNLSPIRTGKISILFPADNLLEEFERIVGSMISKMLSLIKQCDLLIQARDRLLPKLMSGEIEV